LENCEIRANPRAREKWILYKWRGFCKLGGMTMTSVVRTAAAWCALALLCAGCSTVTSLTPSKQPRTKSGYYLLEADWKTDSSTVIDSSLKAYVLIEGDPTLIPMERVPVVIDRWQVYVPVPADQKTLRYRFKFDYMYHATPKPKPNSFLSPEHELTIVDR
jgi:hypothetical protein